MLTTTASGCGATDADDPTEQTEQAVADPSAPAVDADSDLVTAVGDQLTSALALAVATGSSLPRLRPLARRFSALHRAHLGELSRPDEVGDRRVTGTTETARARLLRGEEKLQHQLVRASLEAESGALAQVFAAMAAAVAQERAVAS